MATRRHIIELFLIAAVMVIIAQFLSRHRVTDFMIFCILVLSYDLLYGYMGHLSFGHMLYFGTGTYIAAIFMNTVIANPLLGIAAGVIAGGLLGLLLGAIVVRTHGAPFALINMGLNQIGFFLVASALSTYTRGEDGLPSKIAPLGPLNLAQGMTKFIFVLICLLLVFYLLKRLTDSPYGILIRSIKENETRVKFLGYNTYNYKLITFAISAALAAFAGSLNTINYGFISPSYIDPLRNVEIIFAILIGGAGNLYGAIIGGMTYMLISNFIAIYITRWELFFGIILLFLAFKFKTGITGFIFKMFKAKVVMDHD